MSAAVLICVWQTSFSNEKLYPVLLNDLRAYRNQAKRREVMIAKVTYKPSKARVGGKRSKRDRAQKRQLSMLLSILWKLFNEIIWGNGFIYLSILLETSTIISHHFPLRDILRKQVSQWCNSTGAFPRKWVIRLLLFFSRVKVSWDYVIFANIY